MSCALCEIPNDGLNRVLYADEHVFVAVNIEPLKSGHLMVLPIRHAKNLSDLTKEEASAFLHCINRVMQILTENYKEEPISFLNGWKHRSQPHLHVHVIPSRFDLRHLLATAEGCPVRTRIEKPALDEMMNALRPLFAKK